jgi:hypothetical protein
VAVWQSEGAAGRQLRARRPEGGGRVTRDSRATQTSTERDSSLVLVGLLGQIVYGYYYAIWATTRATALVALGLGPPLGHGK